MKFIRPLIIASACALSGVTAWAADPAGPADHHPASAASASATPSTASSAAMDGETSSRMDTQMEAMRAMHEKVMSAKTPEARQALMAEHMKTMQDGMSMMSGMAGAAKGGMKGNMPSGMPAGNQMMEKRTEMMQTMMLMMADCMPSPSIK